MLGAFCCLARYGLRSRVSPSPHSDQNPLGAIGLLVGSHRPGDRDLAWVLAGETTDNVTSSRPRILSAFGHHCSAA